MSSRPRTRVLLVDDSAVVRKLLGDALRKHDDIEVVGGAADPYIARDMILQHEPDVITLDIEMPRMDGLSFLRKLMEHHPIPAIVVSSLTQQGSAASVEALRIGAIDVIGKPGGPHAVGEVADRVAERIRALRSRAARSSSGSVAPDDPARRPGRPPRQRQPPARAHRHRRVDRRHPGDRDGADADARRHAADRHRPAHAGRLHQGLRRAAGRRLPDARRRGRRRRAARARRRLRRARRSPPDRRAPAASGC